MMKPFEQALAGGGTLVGAWDLDADHEGTLVLFSVGNAGAQRVAEKVVEADQHELAADDLRARNVRIGATCHATPYVWVIDDAGYSVWSRDALVATGKRATDVTRVITFYDPADLGHRGVTLALTGGKDEMLVEERDPASRVDPGYNHDSLFIEGRWATHLGRQLATWLGVPHEDQIDDRTNARHLAIAKVARSLADEVQRTPTTGPFEEVRRSAGTLEPAGEVALRFAPNPLEPAKRFLELKVSSPSGKTTSGRWIKQGTNAQIAAFLRDVATPDTVVSTLHDLLRKQEEDGYA
jgi:hypothetical protein